MGIVFDQSLNTTDNVQFVSLSLGDDTKLVRDSANTFAMRNGASPNNLNVYNTYTSNTDYERLEVKWDSGVPTIAVAVDGNGNYPNWLQIQNESSKFLVKHNGFEFQDATTLLQLNPTNIKVFKDFYPNNDGETSFGTSNNRWLHTYSVNGSFSGNLVVEDGGNQYIYNTYTDASNYERLELKWNISNVAEINTAASGTGIVRTLRMRQSGGSYWADWEAAGIKFYGAASLNFNVGSAATAFYKNINPDTNGSVSCGVSASRWSNTYSIDGSFSGDLNVEVGGSYKLYNLGAAGDTDTEYLETSFQFGKPVIRSLSTGNGVTRDLFVGSTSGARLEVRANGQVFVVGSGSSIGVTSSGVSLGGGAVYPASNDATTLGSSTRFWSRIYSVDGSFSGDLVTEAGGNNYIYNTYTDANNYERLEVKWDADKGYIGTTSAGTGTDRPVFVGGDVDGGICGMVANPATSIVYLTTNDAGGNRFYFRSSNMYSDGGVDLGTSANRWGTTYTDDLTVTNSVAIGDKYGFDGDTNTYIENIGTDWLGFTAGGLSMAGMRGFGTNKGIFMNPNENQDIDFHVGYNGGRAIDMDGATGDVTFGQNIYLNNTYTDASNYERLEFKWDTNVATIDSTAAGTGTQRLLSLKGSNVELWADGSLRFQASNNGINYSLQSLQPASDSVHTLGAAPRRWSTTYTDSIAIGQNTLDAILTADAADTLALRNSTTAQAFNVYNTYTDASNYERLEIFGNGSEYRILSAADGTGAYRNIRLGGYQPSDTSFRGIRLDTSNGIFEWIYNNATKLRCDSTTFNVSATTTTTQDVRPKLDSSYDLGSDAIRWSNTYTDTLIATDTVSAGDGSRTAPAFTFESQSTMGIYRTALNQMNLVVSSSSCGVNIQTDAFAVSPDMSIGWRSANNLGQGTSFDTQLHRESTGVIGQYNQITDAPQAYHLYNTWTDASNYERLEVKWDANVAKIGPSRAGTGSARNLQIGNSAHYWELIPGSTQWNCKISGLQKFRIGSGSVSCTNNIIPLSSLIPDVGTISNRWGAMYVGGVSTGVETFTTSSDTLDTRNNVALCDCTSNAITINLPAASTATGLQFYITKVDNSANTVTIDPDSSETIDGSATKVLTVQYQSVKVVSDGSNWYSVASQPSASDVEGSGTAGSLAVWTDTDTIGTGLLSESSNILTQKNSTNAQAYHLYNTDDGAGNYERLEVKWDTNEAQVATTKGGTGQFRGVYTGILDGSTKRQGFLMDSTLVSSYWSLGSQCYIFSSTTFRPNGDRILGNSSYRWSNTYTDTITIGDGVDAVLTADAADELALRNSTNAQALHVYNTYTDASNYERLEIGWASNSSFIKPAIDGTGSDRKLVISGSDPSEANIEFGESGDVNIRYGGTNNIRIAGPNVSIGSDIYPNSDDVRELGRTNLRWSNVYSVDGDFSGDLTVSGPEGKLVLSGQSSAFDTTSGAVSTIYQSDDDGGSYPFTSVGNLILQSRQNSNRDIVFATGTTPTVRMVVAGNGNVGIGTNTPTSRLHVVGDIYNTGTITTDGGFADLLAVSGTSAPELRINSTDSVIFDGDEFGRLQWYMNDANTNGTGAAARISAIFNDTVSGSPAQQTAGEGTDLVFSTGLVLVTGQTQTVTEKLRIDKNGTFKHAVGTNSYWYNLDTDASNYERFKLGWETNDFVISAEADGSGSIQDLDLVASQVAFKYTSGTGASTRISAGSNYIKMWRDMYPGSDSTWNCGLSANRWNAVCTDTIIIGNGVDAVLTADADNQLALRNSTNAQRFNIYNTYTDASNYERGQFRWGSNILVIGTESAGTGSNRSVWVNIGTSSTKFEFNSTTNKSNQNLQPGTDIVYNLGAASARWANTYTNRLYASDELVVGATSSSSVDHEVELYKRTLIESTSSQLFTVRRSGYPEMLNINSSQRVIRLFGNSDTGSADSNSLQIFGSQYLYNTYTDASNYERLEVKFDTNEAVITPTAAGTGTQRDLVLDGPDIRFRINGTDRFTINKSTSRVETGFDFRPISNNAVSCGAGDRRWFATYTNGLRTAIQTITAASDTLGGNDNINLCDCTSNNITINLPAASGREGLQYHIKKIDSSSNTVTVDADGTETIDGALTQVISAQYESITIVCDGSNWHII